MLWYEMSYQYARQLSDNQSKSNRWRHSACIHVARMLTRSRFAKSDTENEFDVADVQGELDESMQG